MFETLGVMAVDITPVSYTLLWDIPEKCNIRIDAETVAVGQCHKMEVMNATPGKISEVTIFSETSDAYASVSVETLDITEENMCKFYRSRKKSGDIYDLENVRNDTVKYLRKKRYPEIWAQSRHRFKNSKTPTMASIVVSGDTIPLRRGRNMYVVPDLSIDDNQFICLEDESRISHIVEFDKSESFVQYMDNVYPHGSTFVVEAQATTVVEGSFILVVLDDVPAEFLGGDSAALQILTSGDLAVRDIVMRSSAQVTQKVFGDTTYGRNSFYVYGSSDGTTNGAREYTTI